MWLDGNFFLLIWLFTKIKISPKAYKICQSMFKIAPNTKHTLKMLPIYFQCLPKLRNFPKSGHSLYRSQICKMVFLFVGGPFSAHKDALPPPLLPSTTALVIKDVSPHTNEWIKHLSRARFANHRLTTDQCDQIWRNFATLKKYEKFLGNFWCGLFITSQTFVPTLASLSILLGKLSLL